jgi:hypothetical protein
VLRLLRVWKLALRRLLERGDVLALRHQADGFAGRSQSVAFFAFLFAFSRGYDFLKFLEAARNG